MGIKALKVMSRMLKSTGSQCKEAKKEGYVISLICSGWSLTYTKLIKTCFPSLMCENLSGLHKAPSSTSSKTFGIN